LGEDGTCRSPGGAGRGWPRCCRGPSPSGRTTPTRAGSVSIRLALRAALLRLSAEQRAVLVLAASAAVIAVVSRIAVAGLPSARRDRAPAVDLAPASPTSGPPGRKSRARSTTRSPNPRATASATTCGGGPAPRPSCHARVPISG